jgi:hypothetical protein
MNPAAKQRWAMFAMGLWVMGSLATAIVATQNFYTIDRLLAQSSSGPFREAIERLGEPQGRDLLRYLSSELNRLYFQSWNGAQVLLAAIVYWLLSGEEAMRRARLVVLGMTAVVVLMIAFLTPQIVSVGRSLDFVARDPAPPQLGRFWILHGAYTTLEMAKLAAGLLAGFWIERGLARRREVAEERGVS